MTTVAVTGGSGASGRFVVEHLLERDYDVVVLDRQRPSATHAPFREVDITDYGSVHSALDNCDLAVHFAAHPEPDSDFHTGAQRFHNNTMGTYNVFQAAVARGIERVVWASSETTMGYPFDTNRPSALPVTEEQPVQPQNSYAISKAVCEELARQMAQLYGTVFIGLRLSNVLYTGDWHRDNYQRIPSYWHDAQARKFNLWGYIDARDVATAVRLSLHADIRGAEVFFIGADDTIMDRPNQQLIDEVFPGLSAEGLGDYQALCSNEKARKMLGFSPAFSWREMPEELRL